jgi:hypothetical protein
LIKAVGVAKEVTASVADANIMTIRMGKIIFLRGIGRNQYISSDLSRREITMNEHKKEDDKELVNKMANKFKAEAIATYGKSYKSLTEEEKVNVQKAVWGKVLGVEEGR